MKIDLGRGFWSQIDPRDLDLVLKFKWCRNSNGYAMTWDGVKRRFVYMHRLILGVSKGQQVDHLNRDRLDNRRSNLRVASQLINVLNTGLSNSNKSGVKGVYRHPKNPKWIAQIKRDGKVRYLGSFDTLEEAAACRQEAFEQEFGRLLWR